MADVEFPARKKYPLKIKTKIRMKQTKPRLSSTRRMLCEDGGSTRVESDLVACVSRRRQRQPPPPEVPVFS